MAKAFLPFRHPIMADLCAALGLEGVRSLRINLEVDRIATVDASMVLTPEQAERLVEVVRRYQLTATDPVESIAVKPMGPADREELRAALQGSIDRRDRCEADPVESVALRGTALF